MCVAQWLGPWGTPKVQEVNVCVPTFPLVRHLVSDVSLLLLSPHPSLLLLCLSLHLRMHVLNACGVQALCWFSSPFS